MSVLQACTPHAWLASCRSLHLRVSDFLTSCRVNSFRIPQFLPSFSYPRMQQYKPLPETLLNTIYHISMWQCRRLLHSRPLLETTNRLQHENCAARFMNCLLAWGSSSSNYCVCSKCKLLFVIVYLFITYCTHVHITTQPHTSTYTHTHTHTLKNARAIHPITIMRAYCGVEPNWFLAASFSLLHHPHDTFTLSCWQMLPPPQSLHLVLLLPCSHILLLPLLTGVNL